MKDGVFKYYKELPTWGKGIVAIVVIGGLGLISYSVYKRFHKTGDEREVDKEIKELEKLGIKATITEPQAKGYADSLYSAGAGQRAFGTDEDAIYSVFKKLSNDIDVYMVIKAFGTRRKGFSFSDANLGGFISDELDSDEITELNKILSKKGIKYRF